jgi:phage shock protein C
MENRLYRSSKDRILFGVCGGLAKYFGMDSSLMRILVILLTIATGGFGILVYIAMAFIVPLEGSTKSTPREIVLDNVEEAKSTAQGIGQDIKDAFSGQKQESGDREYEQTRRRNIFGVILIVIGVFMLLAVFGFFRLFDWFRWGIIAPVVLIAIGLVIILTITRKK